MGVHGSRQPPRGRRGGGGGAGRLPARGHEEGGARGARRRRRCPSGGRRRAVRRGGRDGRRRRGGGDGRRRRGVTARCATAGRRGRGGRVGGGGTRRRGGRRRGTGGGGRRGWRPRGTRAPGEAAAAVVGGAAHSTQKTKKEKRANRGTACGTGHGPQARCWTRASQRAPHGARSPPPPPDARRVALPRGRRRPLPMDTPLGCALQLARAAVAFGGTDVRCPWAGPCAGRDRGADRSSGPRAGLAAPARAAPPGGLSTSPSGPWSHGGGTRVPPTARRGGGRDEHGKRGRWPKPGRARHALTCSSTLAPSGRTRGPSTRTQQPPSIYPA